jgi:3-keto-L-gulonate-6-phosphate decarboxylase
LAGKYEEMNQAMLQLALENPDLKRALERLAALRAAYLEHGTQHGTQHE